MEPVRFCCSLLPMHMHSLLLCLAYELRIARLRELELDVSIEIPNLNHAI
jgi:hypothetical protein